MWMKSDDYKMWLKVRGLKNEGEDGKKGDIDRLRRNKSQTENKKEKKRKKEIFPIYSLVEMGRSQPAGKKEISYTSCYCLAFSCSSTNQWRLLHVFERAGETIYTLKWLLSPLWKESKHK